MNASRMTATIVGVLFILATVLNVVGTSSSRPILDAQDYLINVSTNEGQVMMGAVLELIAAFAVAGIVIGLYPILKTHHEALALGSVIFRIIEAAFYCVAVVGLLSLLTLSQEYVKAGTPDVSSFQASGTLLLAMRKWAAGVGVVAFTLGGLMYYYVFYRSKLIPRWLSLWGLIAIVLLMVAVLIATLGGEPFAISGGLVLLALPLALQEMVMAIWLIVKGFNPSAIVSGPAKTDLNEA